MKAVFSNTWNPVVYCTISVSKNLLLSIFGLFPNYASVPPNKSFKWRLRAKNTANVREARQASTCNYRLEKLERYSKMEYSKSSEKSQKKQLLKKKIFHWFSRENTLVYFYISKCMIGYTEILASCLQCHAHTPRRVTGRLSRGRVGKWCPAIQNGHSSKSLIVCK